MTNQKTQKTEKNIAKENALFDGSSRMYSDKKWIIVLISITLLSLSIACSKPEQERPANMRELYRTQGVPVRVMEVGYGDFVKEIDYTVTVNGLKETRVYARITDQIQRINARIGQVVEQDQIIINFPEENAQVNFFQVKAAFELAEQTLHRMRGLFIAGGISQQELDGAETQFVVAKANWEAVQQSVHTRAPISGMITDINVREMQRVSNGDYLFTVSQMNKLHGRIWISEDDISSIPRNARVIFRWNDIEKQGRITSIGLSLNRDFNAFAADVEIDNDDYTIPSGVTGRAIVITYHNPAAISIPRNIVLRDLEGDSYIFVINGDTAERRYVTIRNQSDLSFEITSGLSVGDLIIVQGYNMVQHGSKVNMQK